MESESIQPTVTLHPKVAAVLVRTFRIPQRTRPWYERRKIMLTCSDVAAVLGVNKYCSRNQVLKRKMGLIRPFMGNAATRHGIEFEPIALQKYEEYTGHTLVKEDIGLLAHPVYLRLGGSPDGVTTGGILIEIKCPLSRQIIPGTIPEYYIPQVQMLLEIMDLELAHFVQYKPSDLFRQEQLEIVEIKRDRKWFADALPVLLDFIHELDTKYAEKNLPVGTPMKDWDEEDRKNLESTNPTTLKRRNRCLFVEEEKDDEGRAHTKRLRRTITDDAGTVISERVYEVVAEDMKIEFDASAMLEAAAAEASKAAAAETSKLEEELVAADVGSRREALVEDEVTEPTPDCHNLSPQIHPCAPTDAPSLRDQSDSAPACSVGA